MPHNQSIAAERQRYVASTQRTATGLNCMPSAVVGLVILTECGHKK